jgi:hypothetical protein
VFALLSKPLDKQSGGGGGGGGGVANAMTVAMLLSVWLVEIVVIVCSVEV